MGTTHLFLLACAWNIPYISGNPKQAFFGQPLTKAFCRRHFHSELPPGFGSLLAATLILLSLNAGQSLYIIRIAADAGNVNETSNPKQGVKSYPIDNDEIISLMSTKKPPGSLPDKPIWRDNETIRLPIRCLMR